MSSHAIFIKSRNQLFAALCLVAVFASLNLFAVEPEPPLAGQRDDVCSSLFLVKRIQAEGLQVQEPLTLSYIRRVAAFNKGFLPTAVRKALEKIPSGKRAALGAPIEWYMRINMVRNEADALWRVGTSFPTSLRVDRFGGDVFINDPDGTLTLKELS